MTQRINPTVHSNGSTPNTKHYWNLDFGVAAVSLVFESVILIFYLDTTISTTWFVVFHILFIFSLAALVFYRVKTKKETYFLTLLTLSTTLLGPLGALVVLFLISFLPKFSQPSSYNPPNMYESILSGLKKTEQEELFEQLISGNVENFNKSSVIPFMDILYYGTQREKQNLIALLINNYQRSYSPILKEAVKDPDNSIRVLASMGIAQIENRFMKRAIEIESNKDGSEESKEFYFKTLGRHYDEYAYCDILDEFVQMDIRYLAIGAYMEYLSINPLDEEVLFWLGRALLRNGKMDEAALVFDEAMRNNLLSPEHSIWYLESLYQSNEFKKLGESIRQYSPQGMPPQKEIPNAIHQIVKTWNPSLK